MTSVKGSRAVSRCVFLCTIYCHALHVCGWVAKGLLWVLAGCVQFCQLSFKYLFTVVGDDSPERPSVQQRHLRMGAGKSSRAVAMQKGSYVLYTLLSCTACMWVGGC